MPHFPSLEWCRALVSALEQDPAVVPAVKEWGGRSIGLVIGKDKGLDRDFCLFAKPDALQPKLVELKVCEDEDDLELEEPDYLFRAPYGTVRKLLAKQLEPLEVLRKGQIRVEGDLGFLIPFSQRHQSVGDRAFEKFETTY